MPSSPKVVDLPDTVNREKGVLDNTIADSRWGGFHQDTNSVSENAGNKYSCPKKLTYIHLIMSLMKLPDSCS